MFSVERECIFKMARRMAYMPYNLDWYEFAVSSPSIQKWSWHRSEPRSKVRSLPISRQPPPISVQQLACRICCRIMGRVETNCLGQWMTLNEKG